MNKDKARECMEDEVWIDKVTIRSDESENRT